MYYIDGNLIKRIESNLHPRCESKIRLENLIKRIERRLGDGLLCSRGWLNLIKRIERDSGVVSVSGGKDSRIS